MDNGNIALRFEMKDEDAREDMTDVSRVFRDSDNGRSVRFISGLETLA